MTETPPQYDQIGKVYLESQRIFYSKQQDWARKFIADSLPPLSGTKLIDIGCGHGNDIPTYEQLGAEVWAVDKSEVMLEHARRSASNPSQVYKADMRDLPFNNGTFEVATARFSLHYAEDLDMAYREIYRVLTPGGILVAVVEHPFTDFLLQEEKSYGHKETVALQLYGGKVTIHFPTHTLREWLSPTFLSLFDLQVVDEYAEEEKVPYPGMKPPTALCFAAVKRNT